MNSTGLTYILENRSYQRRRYYVGYTENLERRLKEHGKEGMYKKHLLVWYIEGNFEKFIKNTGITLFMDIISSGVTINENEGNSLAIIRRGVSP